MPTKSAHELKNFEADRQTRADAVFAEINFPSSVEEHDGWESFSGGPTPSKRFNTWSKVVYLLNENGGDTIKATFSVVFRPNSIVPAEAWLDDKEMVMP